MKPTARAVRIAFAVLAFAGVTALGLIAAPDGGKDGASEPAASPLGEWLGDARSDTGFARALEPVPLEFPRDHGPHPDYRVEWWYFTGNLTGMDAGEYGYQLTLFRFGLAPGEADADANPWRTHQVWMGHLAISDIDAATHHHAERLSRGGPPNAPERALAGARTPPLAVWLDDWSITSRADEGPAPGSADAGPFPLVLKASDGGYGLELLLSPGKPLVLQGEAGLSRKSAEPGNASYYYSYTRLPTRGHIHMDGRRIEVSGQSWMDREWSTSALADDQAGWDWFSLQLDDGRDLMFYRMRRKDGGTDPASGGVLVARDGTSTPISARDALLTPLHHWTSDHSGRRYPVEWRLRLPAHDLDVTVRARFPDQEMRTRVTYWEGAVAVQGTHNGKGYLEMTGYAGR
ncbi:MAG: lipocalin-like domain-containing protein [Gammaproteobacteria bacterium]